MRQCPELWRLFPRQFKRSVTMSTRIKWWVIASTSLTFRYSVFPAPMTILHITIFIVKKTLRNDEGIETITLMPGVRGSAKKWETGHWQRKPSILIERNLWLNFDLKTFLWPPEKKRKCLTFSMSRFHLAKKCLKVWKITTAIAVAWDSSTQVTTLQPMKYFRRVYFRSLCDS